MNVSIQAELAVMIDGTLQNIDKVVHIRAKQTQELAVSAAPMGSHDLHQEPP